MPDALKVNLNFSEFRLLLPPPSPIEREISVSSAQHALPVKHAKSIGKYVPYTFLAWPSSESFLFLEVI